MIMERNQKIIGIIVLIIGVIAICSSILFMDMNKAEIIIPEEYTLESNNSGVATYKNNLDNGYKLEIKEDSNPNGIKKENMYGLHLFFFMLYYKLCKYMIENHQLRGY